MDFQDLVKNRYSCRRYLDKPIPEDTIYRLLEITRHSASAINMQPWKIKVVSDRDTRERLYPATFGQNQVRTCSHLLVLCADTDYPEIIARLDRALRAAGVDDDNAPALIDLSRMCPKLDTRTRLSGRRASAHRLGNARTAPTSLGLGACP